MRSVFVICFLLPFSLVAQTPKDVRAAAKEGQIAVPKVAAYLNSADVDTRIETVKQLIALGGKDIIDPLIRATKDADPEVEFRATDGLVNYYIPGYVKQGPGSTLIKVGGAVKAHFSDTNDQIVDPFVIVRPEVITALGQLARSGTNTDARANACRAIGILRGDAALPDLIEALRTKDNNVMYESLAAMQKIGDPKAGPRITYLLRDLDDRVQTTAIETAGVLRRRMRCRCCAASWPPAQHQSGAGGAGRDCDDARAEGPRPVTARTGGKGRETTGIGRGRSGENRESGGPACA